MRRSGCVDVLAGFLVATWAVSGPASAHRTCAYQGYNDGCAAAPSDGNYVNKDFFAYAKQSGQGSYYSAPGTPASHPPPWNVAGVDYPVGYRTLVELLDPATGPLPSGCSYSATGSANGGAIVTCSGANDLTFNGWDFSLHNCTVLDIKSNVTGTVRISNSKFVNGSNCSVSNGYLVMIENPAVANFKFEHNYVDGNQQQFPTSLIGLIVPFVQGRMTVKYNAFLNSPARPVVSIDTGPLVFAYNYWEGWVYQPSDGHGEVVLNYLGDDKTQSSIKYSFNTGLEPSAVCSCGTAVWYPTGGGTNSSIGKVVVDHNTSVVNLNNGQVTVAAASAETSYNTYGSVTFRQNYMDPTGSYECFISVGNPTYTTSPLFTGNVNMIDGQTVNDFGSCP
jgi:hypothetical protein